MTITNRLLYGLALVLACACVAGGVLVHRERGERADAKAEQERYGDVMAAARSETEAFVNVDYRTSDKSVDAVLAGVTGKLKEDRQAALDRLTESETVAVGKVDWLGLVSADKDSARVIAATSGTVADTTSQGSPLQVNLRLQIDLELVDGTWLTSAREQVG